MAFSPEVIGADLPNDGVTFDATFTSVTVTLGAGGQYNSGGASPLYFGTAGTTPTNTGWVRWTFAKPVTTVRVYYAFVESVDYSSIGSGLNDPQEWVTSAGPINLAPIADGGDLVASSGDLVEEQPEAALIENYADCAAPNVTCSGYIDLSFPDGIDWIESRNAVEHAGSPGYNGVGLALDVEEVGIPETLANTGTGVSPIAVAAVLVGAAGAGLLVARRRYTAK